MQKGRDHYSLLPERKAKLLCVSNQSFPRKAKRKSRELILHRVKGIGALKDVDFEKWK